MSVAVSNLIIITGNKQFIYRYTVYLCTDERSHWARSFFFPVSEYCLLCLLISAKVQFCWHWTEVNRSVESKSRRSSLFGHQKIREVWKTFLTLTGASLLIALSAAMDRNRLRKAVKYCEKKKKYIYVNCTHYVYWLMNILTTGAKEMVVLSIEVTISLSISIWMTLYQFDLFFLIVVKFI